MTAEPLARNYACSLAGGQRLTFRFEKELGEWAERFAWITGLERVRECTPPVCFVRREPEGGFDRRGAGDGWVEYALPWVRLRWHSRSGAMICGLLDQKHDTDLRASIRLNRKGHEKRIREFIQMDGVLHSIFLYVLQSGGLPLHSALVSLDGAGYLIAGRGNAGKTTCTRRVPEPWQPWCDDLALVVESGADGYQAHALPTWSDYILERECREQRKISRHLPLRAIFFLEQSTADEAISISPGAAAAALYRSAADKYNPVCNNARDPAVAAILRRHVFLNAWSLATRVPAFALRATLDGKFWEEMVTVAPPGEVRAK